jgi:hypothetical protein
VAKGFSLSKSSFVFLATAVSLFIAKPSNAYDLGSPKCGGEYGGLHLRFPPSVLKFSDVESKLIALPWLKKPFVYISGEETTLYDQIKDSFDASDDDPEKYDIAVPVGSEQSIATLLIDAGVIVGAGHRHGMCGGAEVSYMFIEKTPELSNLVNGVNFSNFLENHLESYIKSGTNNGTLETGSLVIAPIEPYFPLKKFTLSVPSEISRGPQAAGTWDRFDVIFALFVVRPTDFVIVVHIEGLQIAPRTNARSIPPTIEHFRALDSGTSFSAAGIHAAAQEYIAAASIAKFIGQSSHNCKVEGLVFSAEKDSPFKCDAKDEF